MSDYWILRLDAQGNKLAEADFGGSGEDRCQAMTLTGDGGVILVGASGSAIDGDKTVPNFGGEDAWIVKTVLREAPVGAPLVLIDGFYSFSNSFTITESNVAQVSLSTTFTNGTIRYTLDGSGPTLSSPLYTVPFNLTNAASVARTFTLNAVAWNASL